MHLNRSILSALVAAAFIIAPMTAAWAGGAKASGGAMPHTVAHAVEGAENGAASPIEDCASMMKGAANADVCPCCDKDMVSPQVCMAKCFQLLGLAQQQRPLARSVTLLPQPIAPPHLLDWSDQPQPPPPRI